MVRLVVMAAGQATRMGRDKLRLPWRDTTVLGYVLQTAGEAVDLAFREQCSLNRSLSVLQPEIYVVTRQPLRTYLDWKQIKSFQRRGGVWKQVPKPQPLAETICCGLKDLKEDTQYIGFLPGDQVGVTVPELAEYLRQIGRYLPDFLVPVDGDKTVSPVFFHRKYVPELLGLRGEQGGRTILSRYPKKWRIYPVGESFYQDLDTPEQYRTLRERAETKA